MHLHGLDIPHGAIAPVGRTKKSVSLHADALHVQSNILITQDGQACLADFGIAAAFNSFLISWSKLETLRYMAPERFAGKFPRDITSFPGINFPSKGGDVYSIMMTSFKVHSSAVNHSIT